MRSVCCPWNASSHTRAPPSPGSCTESAATYWPAGVFVWTRGAILAALERYTPLLTLVEPAYRSDLALQAAYDRMQPLSIDDAVLVGAADDGSLVMAPVDVGWRPIDPTDRRR